MTSSDECETCYKCWYIFPKQVMFKYEHDGYIEWVCGNCDKK